MKINVLILIFRYIIYIFKDLLNIIKINPWNNTWSEFNNYDSEVNLEFWWNIPKKSLTSNYNSNSNFLNNIYEVFAEMRFALKGQEVSNFNNYFPIPYTYGLSINTEIENKKVILYLSITNYLECFICHKRFRKLTSNLRAM
jgi:hypothetical protein